MKNGMATPMGKARTYWAAFVLVSLYALVSGTSAIAAPTHRFLYELAGPEVGKVFKFPSGVTTDSHGHMYVANRGNGAIDVLAPNGDPLTRIEGALGRGYGVAVDSLGNLY